MKNEKQKILLVDDDPDILEFLSYNLKKEGYKIYTEKNGKKGLQTAILKKPHLIILDVMMPESDGIETCEEIRNTPSLEGTLIAFLTARGEDYSQIAGFEAGADDYITKPIKPKVFVSRVKALLKRHKGQNAGATASTDHILSAGDITIDSKKHIVTFAGNDLYFPKKEFKLLRLLVSEPNKVFTREEIFNNVWGEDIVVGDRTIDVHIRKLREKISKENILTIKGVGYKFVP